MDSTPGANFRTSTVVRSMFERVPLPDSAPRRWGPSSAPKVAEAEGAPKHCCIKAHDLGSFSRSCDGGFAKREATRRILKWKRLTVYFYHNCNVHTFINLLCYTWTRKYGIFRRVQPPDQHEFRLDGPSLNRLPSGLVPSP